MSDSPSGRAGYTLGDLMLLRKMGFAGRYSRYPTRAELLADGHSAAVIDRIALPMHYSAYVGRYREVFVPDAERKPERSPRDHLVQTHGYPAAAVDAFLAGVEADLAAVERRRADREAYERTWRYRISAAAFREASRVRMAVDVLRGHEWE